MVHYLVWEGEEGKGVRCRLDGLLQPFLQRRRVYVARVFIANATFWCLMVCVCVRECLRVWGCLCTFVWHVLCSGCGSEPYHATRSRICLRPCVLAL